MEITISGVSIKSNEEQVKRITGLIWGPSGAGKTTLAATAPGKKLFLSFDPDGTASIKGFPDVYVADFSTSANSLVESFKRSDDPLGIAKVINDFDTIIVDSLTTVGEKTLAQGISVTKGASIERPSPGAYGVRNALTLQLVKNILSLTNKHNKHVFFLAHEDAPATDDEGNIIFITMSLGGKLPNQVPLNFSEVWHLSETPKGRRIMIRSARNIRPCKTRMFVTNGEPEFIWQYDIDKHKGATIAGWFEQWKLANNKIPLPK